MCVNLIGNKTWQFLKSPFISILIEMQEIPDDNNQNHNLPAILFSWLIPVYLYISKKQASHFYETKEAHFAACIAIDFSRFLTSDINKIIKILNICISYVQTMRHLHLSIINSQ